VYCRPAGGKRAPLYLRGLLGPDGPKSVQPIAARLGLASHDQLHRFVSSAARDDAPLWRVLTGKANGPVGGGDAVPSEAARSAVDALASRPWRRIAWRQGTKGTLAARFAVLRVRVVHGAVTPRHGQWPGVTESTTHALAASTRWPRQRGSAPPKCESFAWPGQIVGANESYDRALRI
jgi:hypothetical protein